LIDARFFLAITRPIGHNTSVPRKNSTSPVYTPERLTALYSQLHGVLLLQDIVQSGTVEEGAIRYTPGAVPSSDAHPRYRFEKRGKESWAVLDSCQGDALLALTKYKKGAEALVEWLEAYERFIAQLPHATLHQARASDRPAFLAPQGSP
jgi:hypothetical protein